MYNVLPHVFREIDWARPALQATVIWVLLTGTIRLLATKANTGVLLPRCSAKWCTSVWTFRIQWQQSGSVDTNYMFLFTQSLRYTGWQIHWLNSFIDDMCSLMNIRLCAVGAAPGLFNRASWGVRGPNPISYLNRTSVNNLQAVASCLSTEYETIRKKCIYTSMYRSSVDLAHVNNRSICFGCLSSWHMYLARSPCQPQNICTGAWGVARCIGLYCGHHKTLWAQLQAM